MAKEITLVKVRVLVECEHGKPNDVVEIDSALVKSLAGTVDADPAAVEYAESQAK
jgi:hypothetical protein